MTIDRAFLGRLRVEPLDRKKHDRAAFSCGVPRVDHYLQTNAAGLQDVDTARVYVACLDASPVITGFYALNAHAIDLETLPPELKKKLPRYPQIPAIYLSVVGVHSENQGSGVGRFLMADAFKRCSEVADAIGAAFIVLDALNEDAARLYRRLGFEDLPGHSPRMLVSMKRVRAAIGAAAQPVQKPTTPAQSGSSEPPNRLSV